VSLSHLLSEVVEHDQEEQQAADRKKFGYMSRRVVAAAKAQLAHRKRSVKERSHA
jgi:hypothetical protein